MPRPSLGIQDSGTVIKVPVTASVGAALDTLVAVTGEAKASHLRRAVARYLADFDLLSPQDTPLTLTSLTTTPKEQRL